MNRFHPNLTIRSKRWTTPGQEHNCLVQVQELKQALGREEQHNLHKDHKVEVAEPYT